jgi:phosphoribosylanthranilate isomerase
MVLLNTRLPLPEYCISLFEYYTETMPLRTLVKVGNITNLSDARYCAGMGVEMLGFNTVPGKANYINPKAYQEIRGWVSGPLVVAEIYDLEKELLPGILENYRPDFIELAVQDLTVIRSDSSTPLILAINEKDFRNWQEGIARLRHVIRFVVINQSENPDAENFISDVSKEFSVLLQPAAEVDVRQALTTLKISGIILNGSKEIKPGLKNYDHLAEVLEQLDVD